jgi:ribosomal protein S6
MKTVKNSYQLTIVLNPSIEEKERDSVLKKFEGWLEAEKAEVVKNHHLGQKDLVYEIKGHNKGDFWVYEVESESPINLKTLNLSLNREPNIIRYLILKN